MVTEAAKPRRVTKRTPQGWAREARRARSSTKLSGLAGRRPGEEVSGHPAMFDMRPAFELGRLPEGGGYPHGLVELAAELMGCAHELDKVVHLCSGSVKARRTFDLRAAAAPAVICDVRWLPIGRGQVRWIMADPPYSPEHAEDLWGTGKRYPTPAVLLRECAEVLAPGGRVAFLHFLVPHLPPALTRIGTWGISVGPGYRMRALTIAEKVAPPATLDLDARPPCCICMPGCDGVDGERPCLIECGPCLHGCPAPAGEVCCREALDG